jgi:hypothetical protein
MVDEGIEMLSPGTNLLAGGYMLETAEDAEGRKK